MWFYVSSKIDKFVIFELTYKKKNIATIFYIISAFAILVTLLPLIDNKHWIFRVWVYGKIQIAAFLLVAIAFGLLFVSVHSVLFYVVIGFNLIGFCYHCYELLEFTPLYYWFHKKNPIKGNLTSTLNIISSNVYQFNDAFQKFIKLIEKRDPHIFITYESDQKWEDAIEPLCKTYPHQIKIAQDNTYGMHLFSKIPFNIQKVHHFVSDDIPCIEIEITIDNQKLRLFAVHPPPPSPTEEETSKERDGELMAIAKYIRQANFENVIVVGDFNNVAWDKSSIRFRKLTGLNDPRVGRGMIPTFHAKYWFLRVPIDLLFHSTTVVIRHIETTEYIESDHFPLYFSLQISSEKEEASQEEEESEDVEEMEKDILEGKEEDGDRD